MTKEAYIARQSLVNRLMQDIESLHQKIDEQQECLKSLTHLHSKSHSQDGCTRAHLPATAIREKFLAAAIQEAIAGLERTRKSIKSKQLETIRLNLIKALSEFNTCDSRSVSKNGYFDL
ncbi:hypothetical protein [Desulfonatronovibrio magnus]|uniref:hypothetical protein n=1 Tax=Desulfonatronovibrio magnus TaxID=698827 RepID=UPI0005EB28AA|nr:hypothetical protein [Desulfonatronovibrio magnus]